jgi:flagellar biosynthesis protein FlhG
VARRRRPLNPVPLAVVGAGEPAPMPADHPAHWARPHVRTIAITGGKGGVGKSHFAANLAVALGARGARVLLVDAELQQASLDLLLGVHPRWDLQHWLTGERTLEELVIDGPPGVRLVPAGGGSPEMTELDDYRRECLLRGLGQLETDLDLILLDVPAGLSMTGTAIARAADDVIVLTTPEMPAFADAYALVKVLHARGLAHAPHLVVSMAGSAEEADETAHRIRLVTRRFLRIDLALLGSVPFDPAVARAARLQEPAVLAFPNAPASLAYQAIAERLWDGRPNDPESTTAPTVPQRLEA